MICIRLWRNHCISIGAKCRSCNDAERRVAMLEQELTSSTQDQIEGMRTLSAFRRQYHDGTGELVKEVNKLRRSVERLKMAVKGKG